VTDRTDPGCDTGRQEEIMDGTAGATRAAAHRAARLAARRATAASTARVGDPVEAVGPAMLQMARSMGMPPAVSEQFSVLFDEGRRARAARPVPALYASQAQETPGEVSARRAAAMEARRVRRQRAAGTFTQQMPKRFQRPFPGQIPDAVRTWTDDATGTCNLVLWGEGIGTGKSHLGWRVGQRRVDAGQWVVGWSMVMLNQALRPDGDRGALQEALDCDVLLIDELGGEKVSDWTLEQLLTVVGHRWENEKPVIVSTNLAPEDLERRYDARIADRLLDDAVLVEMTGTSRRRPPRG
jgi:DNA replication protein DnaC